MNSAIATVLESWKRDRHFYKPPLQGGGGGAAAVQNRFSDSWMRGAVGCGVSSCRGIVRHGVAGDAMRHLARHDVALHLRHDLT